MSLLDEIFKNPKPGYIVNRQLYVLYMSQMVVDGCEAGWTEAELIERLQSFGDYLKFLNQLNNAVVQEIADVDAQLYGELDQDV